MVYGSAAAGSPYNNGDQVLFTFSSSGSLMLTNQYTVVSNSFTPRGTTEYVWVDAARNIEFALSVLNGLIHEVNVFGMGGAPFLGQFTPVAAGGGTTGGGTTGGTAGLYNLDIGFGPSLPVATINNVPKPNTQAEFCSSPTVTQSINTNLGVGATVAINNCTFSGNIGTITLTQTITGLPPFNFTVTYTYTPV